MPGNHAPQITSPPEKNTGASAISARSQSPASTDQFPEPITSARQLARGNLKLFEKNFEFDGKENGSELFYLLVWLVVSCVFASLAYARMRHSWRKAS